MSSGAPWFHGKAPSKNKQEIRLQKAAEEIARRKNATSEIAHHQEVEGLRKIMQYQEMEGSRKALAAYTHFSRKRNSAARGNPLNPASAQEKGTHSSTSAGSGSLAVQLSPPHYTLLATEKTHQPYVVLQGKGAAETLKAATAAGSEKAKIPPPPPPGSSGAAGMRRVGGGSAKAGGAAGGKVTDMRPPSGIPAHLRKPPASQ
eukprot:1160484-Pelagomonas_calceolata.AAC.4